jgi:hypothetical protein
MATIKSALSGTALLPLLFLATPGGASSAIAPSVVSPLAAPAVAAPGAASVAPGVPCTGDIAKAAIQQMYSQVALFVSLSLAICGGLLLLMLQALVHNHDHAKRRIHLICPWMLIAAFSLQVVSAMAGLLCIAAITDAVPSIFGARFDANTTLFNTRFDGDPAIAAAGQVQVWFFIFSLAFMVVFIIINSRLIASGRSHGMRVRSRRWRSTTLVVLALSAGNLTPTMARIQGKPADGNPALREVPADFEREIAAASKAVIGAHVSQAAAQSLVAAVDSFLGRRLEAGAAGDEQSQTFREELRATRDLFVSGLGQLDESRLASLDLTEFKEKSYAAYSSNRERSSPFLRRHTAGSVQAGQDDLVTVLSFSMAVYATNPQRWREASQKSHFWPLCHALR